MTDKQQNYISFLEYAHWTGSAWSVEEITQTQTSGVSMRLDSHNMPHIVTSDLYLTNDDQGWITEAIDVGAFPAIGLDPADQPCISSQRWDLGLDQIFIEYAHRESDNWFPETVGVSASSDGKKQ